MAVPMQKEMHRPILEILDGAEEDAVPKRYIRKKVIERFSLTDDDLLEKVPSGQSRVENRVHWALTELKKPVFCSLLRVRTSKSPRREKKFSQRATIFFHFDGTTYGTT